MYFIQKKLLFVFIVFLNATDKFCGVYKIKSNILQAQGSQKSMKSFSNLI